MSNVVLIVGAGCSAGAMSLPTDVDFLDRKYNEIKKEHIFLETALNYLYSCSGRGTYHWKTYRLEIVWSEIDANYNSAKMILFPDEIETIYGLFKKLANEENKKSTERIYYHHYYYMDGENRTPYQYLFMFAGWELKKLILKTYNVVLQDDKKDLYRKLLNFCAKEDNLEVISFNYDTLIEQSLDKCYHEGIDNSKQGGIKIIKPHGSIDWVHLIDAKNRNKETINHTYKPLEATEVGIINGKLYQPSLVGLIDAKREYSGKDQSKVVDKTYRRKMSNAVLNAIVAADKVVIVGYSLPSGDRHIRGLLKKAKDWREKKKKQPIKEITMVRIMDSHAEEDAKNDLVRLFHVEQKNVKVCNKDWQTWIEEQCRGK